MTVSQEHLSDGPHALGEGLPFKGVAEPNNAAVSLCEKRKR